MQDGSSFGATVILYSCTKKQLTHQRLHNSLQSDYSCVLRFLYNQARIPALIFFANFKLTQTDVSQTNESFQASHGQFLRVRVGHGIFHINDVTLQRSVQFL